MYLEPAALCAISRAPPDISVHIIVSVLFKSCGLYQVYVNETVLQFIIYASPHQVQLLMVFVNFFCLDIRSRSSWCEI